MKKRLFSFIFIFVLSFSFGIVNLNVNYQNKYVYNNDNILNSNSIKTNILPINSRNQINCPEGYSIYPVDNEVYCVNQFENLRENGILVKIRGTGSELYCLAMSLPYDNTLSFSDNCSKIGSGWVHDETGNEATEGLMMCKNENIEACLFNEYFISYDYNGGYTEGDAPASAEKGEVVRISKPKNFLVISGSDTKYGGVVGEATKLELLFDGWIFDGDTTTALYGKDSSNVINSWNSDSTKVKDEYFKNLTNVGSEVKLTATWKLGSTEVKFPTYKKDGYKCKWYQFPNPTAESVGYDPGSTVDMASKLTGADVTFYIDCIKDSSAVIPPNDDSGTGDQNSSTVVPPNDDSSVGDDSGTGDQNSSTVIPPNDDSSVEDNPGTGDVAIFLVLIVALGAIIYSINYFKAISENN